MAKETRLHVYNRSFRDVTLDDIGASSNSVSEMNFTSDFTVEFWLRFDTAGATDACVTSQADGGATGFNILKNNINSISCSGGAVPSVTLSINTWYHVALTFTSTQLEYYLNGVSQGTASYTPPATNTMLGIGMKANAVSGLYNGFGGGRIADVRIWREIRTQQQIQIYANERLITEGKLRGDVDTSNLISYYPIDEGTGTTLNNYGSGGTNLTVSSGNWLTDITPPIADKKYKGQTDKFILNGIQQNINNGISALDFTIPNILGTDGSSSFNSVENTEVQLDYKNDLRPSETIFKGFVRTKNTRLKNVKSVNITAFTALEFLTNGYTAKDSDGTYNFTFTAQSIEDCIKEVIDSYNIQNPPIKLNYTPTSLEATGKNITITFYNPKNVLSVIQDLYQQTDANWIWYIDSNSTFYLKQIPSAPDYIFTYGKDFIQATENLDATKVINRVRLTNGTDNRAYQDDNSILSYGQKLQIKTYSGVNANELDNIATNLINNNKNPVRQIKAKILEGQYEISTALIGKVFSVVNTDQTIVDQVITTVNYYPQKGYADIVSSDRETFIARELASIKEDQHKITYGTSSPNTYTEVAI